MVGIEQLLLLIRLLIGTVLISYGISKVKHFEESIVTIEEYKIIPKFLIKPFAFINITLEILLGLHLYMGLFQEVASFLAILLLTVYITAIMINLIKGRVNISCGCGGILGSKGISWWLVLRNVSFIVVLIPLCFYSSGFVSIENNVVQFFQDIYSFQFLLTLFAAGSLFNIYTTIKQLFSIKEHIRSFT
jgi:uncharacterized membrane protein YphA (DoxX/SURF4 family)